jgi:hypothetical protein
VGKGLVEVERRDFDVHKALLDAPQQVPVLVVLDKQLPLYSVNGANACSRGPRHAGHAAGPVGHGSMRRQHLGVS